MAERKVAVEAAQYKTLLFEMLYCPNCGHEVKDA